MSVGAWLARGVLDAAQSLMIRLALVSHVFFAGLSLVIFLCFSLVTVFLHKSRTSHATLSALVSMPRAKLRRVASGPWMSRDEHSTIVAFSSDPYHPGVGRVLACLRCGGGSSLLPLLSPLSRMK